MSSWATWRPARQPAAPTPLSRLQIACALSVLAGSELRQHDPVASMRDHQCRVFHPRAASGGSKHLHRRGVSPAFQR
jgi:hypothetical protein